MAGAYYFSGNIRIRINLAKRAVSNGQAWLSGYLTDQAGHSDCSDQTLAFFYHVSLLLPAILPSTGIRLCLDCMLSPEFTRTSSFA